jgi:hypothetical protein
LSFATLEVSYANFFDDEPMNNYPVLSNFSPSRNLEVNAPIAHPMARISYENFYDANPWNDFPIIIEQPALAKVGRGLSDLHLDYSNFMDNNPYNDFVIVTNEPRNL